jgi:HTH-type transcriptional regulator / antitoxin HigA
MAETRWHPDWAVAPGDVLAEALEERAMSQAELGRRMARPLKTISEISSGKAAITPDTAIQLERTLGMPAGLWLGLETQYREAQARARDAVKLESHKTWLSRFPLSDLVRRGVLERNASAHEQAAQLLSFFGVSSPQGWTQHWGRVAAAYRMSERLPVSNESVAVWLRLAELRATEELPEFDDGRLREGISRLRGLSRSQVVAGGIAETARILLTAGVGLLLVEGVRGAPASGAVRWIRGNPWIILTARHASDDQFWFSLFHEIGHLLERRGKRDVLEQLPDRESTLPTEQAANAFARTALIPQAEYESWVRGRRFDRASIREFAAQLGVAPGIVVGRLQHDEVLSWSAFNDLKRSIRG